MSEEVGKFGGSSLVQRHHAASALHHALATEGKAPRTKMRRKHRGMSKKAHKKMMREAAEKRKRGY